MTDQPVLAYEQLKACRDTRDELLKRLEIMEAMGLDQLASLIRQTADEIGRFHDEAEADKRSRAIGDPSCPAGYR